MYKILISWVAIFFAKMTIGVEIAPLHHALKYPGGSGPFPTIILLHHAGGYLNTLDQIEHYVGLGSLSLCLITSRRSG